MLYQHSSRLYRATPYITFELLLLWVQDVAATAFGSSPAGFSASCDAMLCLTHTSAATTSICCWPGCDTLAACNLAGIVVISLFLFILDDDDDDDGKVSTLSFGAC